MSKISQKHIINGPSLSFNPSSNTGLFAGTLSHTGAFTLGGQLTATYHTTGHNPNNIDPNEDGKSHINIYSQGKTEVGRVLSNWDKHPLILPHGVFYGIEPYWFYLKSGGDPVFWVLSGWKAKEFYRDEYEHGKSKKYKEIDFYTKSRVGRNLNGELGWKADNTLNNYNNFKMHITNAFWMKYLQHPKVKELLINSHLPFKHYYTYGTGDKKVLVEPKEDGTINTWEWIRQYAKYYDKKV